jgi:RNA polymerase sigma factor (sigma-70 family)
MQGYGGTLVDIAGFSGSSLPMAKDTPVRTTLSPSGLSLLLDGRASLLEKLYAESQAARWGLGLDRFSLSLESSATKRFAGESASPQKIEDYLCSLHLEDLALAAACAAGCESAWEHFFTTYRQYLYSAAAAITKRPSSDAYAREFADSLYATLYGRETALGRVSVFNHFHGRSKLSTWLRAVLAQRYIDVLRQEQRLEGFEDDEGFEKAVASRHKPDWEPADPDRARYLRLLARALKQAISSLDRLDRTRLISYYLKDLTLAEIGKALNEHEATVSRKLERVRQELKAKVIAILKSGCAAKTGAHPQPGLADAQIELCFTYATEAWPFDFSHLLETIPPSPGASKSPPPDGSAFGVQEKP